MRMSWRMFVLIVLAGAFPQMGCHHMPGSKSVQGPPPMQKGDPSATTQQRPGAKPAPPQAKALDETRKTSDAIAAYEQLRTTDSSQAHHATKKLAFLHLRNNDLDRAEQEYQILWQHDPRDADVLCALGDISYRRGHFGIAEKMFRDALSKKADHPHALASLGMTLAQKGEYVESVETFKKLGSEAEAYCQVAFVMNLNKKHEDAMRAYQTALAHNPGLQRARDAMTQMIQSDPTLVVRMATPFKTEKRGVVDLEPASAMVLEGSGRLMMQRPTLPPSPDFDLAETNGRDWQTSAKKK